MKVKIVNNGMNTRDCKVFIDGQDVTKNLTEIDVKIKGGEIPTLKLAFYPDDIEIEGDYEVLKKIKELPKDNIEKEKINNKYTQFAEKINALAETVEELAVIEDKDSKGEDVSDSEAYVLIGKFMMQIMELQQGIPE